MSWLQSCQPCRYDTLKNNRAILGELWVSAANTEALGGARGRKDWQGAACMKDGPAAEPSSMKVSLGRGKCGWKGKLERILGRKTSWGGVLGMVGGR